MGKDLRYNRMALLFCAIACCSWSYVLALKYYRLDYTSWDLPLYANLMWNLCHGSVSTSLFGGNFLIDHFNGIAFLMAPFYYFSQSALTMLDFKLFAFFAGAYVFYLLAAKRLGGLWALAFMLAYMFYPPNVAMIFFEFNFENLALPMVFLLFYFFEEKKFLSFMVCCFLLTTVKENMPLVVFMFGIYAFLARREDRLRWGLYPFLLGGGMFIAEVFLIIPWFRHGLWSANAHLNVYSHLGGTPREIARTFIFKEPEIFKLLFNSRNLSFLWQLFGTGCLLMALLAPQILLIASPLFLQDLLSKFPGQQSIDYFYASTLTVFIFMAVIDFLGHFKVPFKTYLLFAIIVFVFIFDWGYIPRWQQRLAPFEEKQAVSQYFLSQIPPGAKVISSYKFLYMLSQRKDLYVLFLRPNKPDLQEKIISDDVDYMAADFGPEWGRHKDYVEEVLSQGQWTVQAAADEVVLLRKNAQGEMLISTGDHPLSGPKPLAPGMMVGDVLRMEGLEAPVSLKFGQRTMRIVFYWEALKDDENTSLPPVYLNILQGAGRFYFKARAPFYGLPLKKGEHYKEVFYYFIPWISPGRYSVVISSTPFIRWFPGQTSLANVCIKNISVL